MSDARKFSRRQFLRRTAAASAVVASPYVIPSGVLAAPGETGPNDRIGIAGIGVGRQGGGRFLAAANNDLGRGVAVADVNLNRAKQMASAAKHKTEVYQDYRKLLERKDVDAIVTATPDHWRALVCIHAAQAGKDIYAEKPMTLTIREGRLVAQAVRKYKRVFQTGSQQRSMAANRYGCELVRNGRIGKVHTVIGANYPSPWFCELPAQPVPGGLDWDMWCGPVDPVPYNSDICTPRVTPGWISLHPFSGGEMTGWGAHGLDQIQWALGMDESGPVEIWTEGPKYDPPKYKEPTARAIGDALCKSPTVFFKYPGDITVKLDTGSGGWRNLHRRQGQNRNLPRSRDFQSREYSERTDQGRRDSSLQKRQPHGQLAPVHQDSREAYRRRGNRPPLDDRVPLGQHRPMGRPQAPLGPGERDVHRRRGGQRVSRSTQTQGV